LNGASARTVQRWCDAGEVPGATQNARGRWHIPPGSVRVEALPDAAAPRRDVAVSGRGGGRGTQPLGLSEALDRLPAYLTLEQASNVLGISVTSIKRNAERLAAEPVGFRGSLMVPKWIVRQIDGLPLPASPGRAPVPRPLDAPHVRAVAAAAAGPDQDPPQQQPSDPEPFHIVG
jgi:hypothetical protein